MSDALAHTLRLLALATMLTLLVLHARGAADAPAPRVREPQPSNAAPLARVAQPSPGDVAAARRLAQRFAAAYGAYMTTPSDTGARRVIARSSSRELVRAMYANAPRPKMTRSASLTLLRIGRVHAPAESTLLVYEAVYRSSSATVTSTITIDPARTPMRVVDADGLTETAP